MRAIATAQQVRAEKRNGATAVEFAIVAPVILLLFLGAVEINNLNFIKHTAANAAYEGARTAMVAGGTAELATQQAQECLDSFGVGNGAEVLIGEASDRITVTVRVPAHLNSYGLSRFTGNLHVTQTCAMSRENRQAEP